MSISFYGFIESSDGWTFPPSMDGRMNEYQHPSPSDPDYVDWLESDDLGTPNPNYDSRLNVNLTNDNAKFVLNELGFLVGDMWDAEPIALDVFEIGLRTTQARNPVIEGVPGYMSHEPGRVRVISFGLSDGYANEKIERLLLLVAAAREYGATHIGWG